MLVAPESRQNLSKLAEIFWDANRNIIATECLWCGNWFAFETFLRHLPDCNRSPQQVKVEALISVPATVVHVDQQDIKPNIIHFESVVGKPAFNESPVASPASHHSDNNSGAHSNDDEKAVPSVPAVITAAVFTRQLLKHLEEQASSKSFIVCDLCGHSAKDRTQMLLHLRTKHLHQTPQKPNVKPQAKPKSKPHRTVPPKAEQPPKTYPCPHCTEIFTTYRLRLLHKQRTHRMHVCEFCASAFGNPSNLTQHRLQHTSEPSFQCRFDGCERRYLSASRRNAHEKTHKKTHKGVQGRSKGYGGRGLSYWTSFADQTTDESDD